MRMKLNAETALKAPGSLAADTASIFAATADSMPDPEQALLRARAFAEPLIGSEVLDTGENTLAHADAVVAILRSMGGSQAMQAAIYLVHASQHLNKPLEVISKAFGSNFATLALETNKLVDVQRQARTASAKSQPTDNSA